VRKLVLFVCILCAVVVVASCSKKEEQQKPETVATTGAPADTIERPAHWPESRDRGDLQGSMIDTLRVKKKRFNITRDQYWDDQGGVLGNEYFEVWYPPGRTTVTHGMYVFEELMPARNKLAAFFGEAPKELLVITSSPSIEAYKKSTGHDWWYYSVIKGDSVTFSPIFVLFKRGISPIAVPHEYYQWAIQKITRYGAPRWLEEGFASYLSGEGKILLDQMYEFEQDDISMTPERIEEVLQGEPARKESRIAYYRSYRMVEKLVDTYGQEKLRDVILAIGHGDTVSDAFEKTYGAGYDEILKIVSDYKVDLTKKGS
jgi:hypothetical protein